MAGTMTNEKNGCLWLVCSRNSTNSYVRNQDISGEAPTSHHYQIKSFIDDDPEFALARCVHGHPLLAASTLAPHNNARAIPAQR